MDFMRFHSQPMSQLPSDLSDIIDFFIALTICNTVVVSSPNQPRQKVKLFRGYLLTLYKKLPIVVLYYSDFSVTLCVCVSLHT